MRYYFFLLCSLTISYNEQEAEGVRIPEVLVPFMGGITFLPFVRGPKPTDKSSAQNKPAASEKKPSGEKPQVTEPATAPPIKVEEKKTPESVPPAQPAASEKAKDKKKKEDLSKVNFTTRNFSTYCDNIRNLLASKGSYPSSSLYFSRSSRRESQGGGANATNGFHPCSRSDLRRKWCSVGCSGEALGLLQLYWRI